MFDVETKVLQQLLQEEMDGTEVMQIASVMKVGQNGLGVVSMVIDVYQHIVPKIKMCPYKRRMRKKGDRIINSSNNTKGSDTNIKS